MTRHLLLLTLFCLTTSVTFSQTRLKAYPGLNNATYFFPELSGWHGGLQTNLDYRNQWPGLPATMVYYSMNTDAYIDKWHTAMGVSLNHHRANLSRPWTWHSTNTNEASFHIAPKIKSGEITWMPAVECSFFQFATDEPELYPPTPGSTPITDHVNKLSFSAGLGLVYKELFAVTHVDYLNQPDISFFASSENRIPRQYRALVGRNFKLGQVRLTPSATFSTDTELNTIGASLSAQYKWIYVGSRYVLLDNIGFAAGVEIAKRVRIGYAYDMTVSRLGTQTLGSHQLTIRALFFKDRVKRRFLENLPII